MSVLSVPATASEILKVIYEQSHTLGVEAVYSNDPYSYKSDDHVLDDDKKPIKSLRYNDEICILSDNLSTRTNNEPVEYYFSHVSSYNKNHAAMVNVPPMNRSIDAMIEVLIWLRLVSQ